MLVTIVFCFKQFRYVIIIFVQFQTIFLYERSQDQHQVDSLMIISAAIADQLSKNISLFSISLLTQSMPQTIIIQQKDVIFLLLKLMNLPNSRQKMTQTNPLNQHTIQYNPYRRTLKPPPFSCLDTQERTAGKISKNVSRSRQRDGSGQNRMASYASVSLNKEDIVQKVKHLQIAAYPSQPISALSQLSAVSRLNISRKDSSSDHHSYKYGEVIAQFEKKKLQVDQELYHLKAQQVISGTSGWKNKQSQDETPKFAATAKIDLKRQYRSMSTMEKETRKQKKAQKDSRWKVFLSNLIQQVDLDERLRNAKLAVPKDSSKEVAKILRSQHGLSQMVLTLDSQEFDPYFQGKTGAQPEELASRISSCYHQSESHWRTHMQYCYPEQILHSLFDTFEGSQKGVISLKSMVRQLGVMMQNQRYFRSRDLYRIYKRISPFTRDRFLRELGTPKTGSISK